MYEQIFTFKQDKGETYITVMVLTEVMTGMLTINARIIFRSNKVMTKHYHLNPIIIFREIDGI